MNGSGYTADLKESVMSTPKKNDNNRAQYRENGKDAESRLSGGEVQPYDIWQINNEIAIEILTDKTRSNRIMWCQASPPQTPAVQDNSKGQE